MFLNYQPAPPAQPTTQLSGVMELLADENVMRRFTGNNEDCVSALRSLNLSDEFWMYEFKVVPCAKSYSHKWTLCPCAHAGETARRRCPRTINYKAVLCPLVKAKKTCPLGDSCSFAHNVFEHWLHPSRYKTRLCSFGRNCNRPICFFAHSAEELRCVPNVEEGKEMDDREYLLQLVLAQESGQLGLLQNNLHQHAVQGLGHPTAGNAHSLADMVDVQRIQQQHTQLQQQQQQMRVGPRAMPNRTTVSVANMGTVPVAINPAAAASEALMRELRNNSSMNSAQSEPLMPAVLSLDNLTATPHVGRLSDPGTGNSIPVLDSQVNPIPHMNRISDSGQMLGIANPKGLAVAGLESLLPLVNSALASGKLSLPGRVSINGRSKNGSSGTGSPSHSSSPSSPGRLSDDLGRGSSSGEGSLSDSPNPKSAAAVAAAVAVAADPSGTQPNAAYLHGLMAHLQEQGLAGNKEQLVASLSQLLAQLLSVN